MSGAAADHGSLVVLAAPSGAGKTTLVRELLTRMPDIAFSVSHTTRAPRSSEIDGRDYYFVNDVGFKHMIDNDEFLEHALVFDHWYGTSRAEVDRLRAQGKTVLLEIDWQGARQVRAAADDATTIFVVPPSVATLASRLRSRATDSEETIRRRLKDSVSDLGHWSEFDYIIVNDDLKVAADALAEVVAGGGSSHLSSEPAVRDRVAAILAGSP